MSEIKAEAPKVDVPAADAPHDIVADTIHCKSLIVSSPDTPHSITLDVNPYCAGVWVTTNDSKSTVGLVVEKNGLAYVTFYGPEGPSGAKSLPALAIAAGLDGKPVFQLASGEQISFEDVHKAVHIAQKLGDAFKGADSCEKDSPTPAPTPEPAPEPAPEPEVPQPAPGTPDEMLQFGTPQAGELPEPQ